jgi:hypothetical protein
LKNTLNQNKSGGDRIRGGEGLESPRNRQARGERALNCLEASLGRCLREVEKKKKSKKKSRDGQRVKHPWDRTCLVNRPDMSSGTPNRTCLVESQTCLVRYGFFRLGRESGKS